MVLSLRGSVRMSGGGASFTVKAHEILAGEGETVHTEGIVPVYPASESISARVLRDLVHESRRAARSVPDPLPGTLRAAERLPTRADAVLAIHAPRSHPKRPPPANGWCSRSCCSCSSASCCTSTPPSKPRARSRWAGGVTVDASRPACRSR